MQCEPPDKQFFAEIRDLNLGFLHLIADAPEGDEALDLLGIPAASGAAIRALAPAELTRVACVPVLLARLDSPDLTQRVAETPPLPRALDPQWRRRASLFAAGLLTYLWQLARRQPVAASLCLGPDPTTLQALAHLSGQEVLACGAIAASKLRARRVFRAPFLPDLLRAARVGADSGERPGLELIPLGLAPLRPGPGRRGGY